MAISGTFTADFASFYAAVQAAEVSLRGFEMGAAKVERSLDKMVDSFSGREIITAATLATEAVERIGGATKLTEVEQAALNVTLTEAIEKYTALGQDAPESMVKLQQETAKVAPELDKIPTASGSILASLAPLASAFGITFSVSAVIAFGRALLDDADALVKLSEKTGIAIEPLQRLKFIGDQSSVTLDQMTGAINQMQRRLADGDDSAVGALSKLGISLAGFMALTPDEKFMTVARAIAEVEDPMQRVKLAMDLMGRSGTEVLPALIAQVDDLAAQSTVMSEQTVTALDRVGDTFAAEWARIKNIAGEGAGAFAEAMQRMGDAAAALLTGRFGEIPLVMAGLADVQLPKATSAMDALIPSTKGVALSMDEVDRIGKELTTTTEKQIVATTALKRGQDALFGRDTIQRALDYAEQLGGIENITRLTTAKKQELKTAVEAAQLAYEALGEKAPPQLTAILTATTKIHLSTREFNAELTKWEANQKILPPFTGLLEKLETTLKDTTNATGAFNSGLRFQVETIEDLKPELDDLNDKYVDLKAAAEAAFRAQERPLPTVNPFTGEGMEGTDPIVRGYLNQGYTIGEAMALAGGYGHHIGQAHGYWDASGWHEGQRRARGGPVTGGQAYLVGEQGPELYVPNASGAIIPRGAGGGVHVGTIHVDGNVLGTERGLALLIRQALVDFAAGQGQLLGSRA